MKTYAILHNPGHNRVYFKSSRKLAQNELALAGINNIREVELGGLPYLIFDAEDQLNILLLSRLSFVYAIFEYNDKNGALLPIIKDPAYSFKSDDITTILKYNGKTNELFTRLMLNVAIFCGRFSFTESLSILDPLCGKGTTLFEGLLNGHSVYGVEKDERIVHEAYTFLKKYLETAKIKHSSHQERQGMKGYTAKRYQIKLSTLANNTETSIISEFIAGDTRDVSQFFRKNSLHVIVGDLPYGVQHGSKHQENKGIKNQGNKNKKSTNVSFVESRNALPLLLEALPSWHKVLKPGGTIVLAWNLFLIQRDEMEQALEGAGFKLVPPIGDESFVHRVDQAIMRDVIVGLKS